LVQATAHQFERELGPIDGTIVGFWSPPYASGLEVAGYHFHFLTDDRRAGGHVLDCAGHELRAQIQMEGSVHIALPDTRAFLTADLERDPTADLAAAEH
jgi:acetolactate decarboxylase